MNSPTKTANARDLVAHGLGKMYTARIQSIAIDQQMQNAADSKAVYAVLETSPIKGEFIAATKFDPTTKTKQSELAILFAANDPYGVNSYSLSVTELDAAAAHIPDESSWGLLHKRHVVTCITAILKTDGESWITLREEAILPDDSFIVIKADIAATPIKLILAKQTASWPSQLEIGAIKDGDDAQSLKRFDPLRGIHLLAAWLQDIVDKDRAKAKPRVAQTAIPSAS